MTLGLQTLSSFNLPLSDKKTKKQKKIFVSQFLNLFKKYALHTALRKYEILKCFNNCLYFLFRNFVGVDDK
jgi:anaerobic ribonucleoside-triphosphate reductase